MKNFSIFSIFSTLLFVLFVSLFSVENLAAQELTVKTFELRQRDLTAKVKPRTAPVNGDPCALVRVQMAAPNCVFEGGYIVGDVEQGFGEYLVYMAQGARNLRIAHPEFLFTPLDYTFPEPLEGNRTYALILEVPIYTHYDQIVEQQSQNQAAQSASPSAKPAATKPATTPAAQEKRWKVGDYYNENGKEGVVFWVDESGKHGKIVSMKDSSTFLEWCSDKKERKRRIGANSETDGAKNMEAVKKRKNWQSKYPAFKWCADLGEGWYLPAKKELQSIYKVKDSVNKTLEDRSGESLKWYWSSTESNEKYKNVFCAWLVTMRNGDAGSLRKGNAYYVRAVSAF